MQTNSNQLETAEETLATLVERASPLGRLIAGLQPEPQWQNMFTTLKRRVRDRASGISDGRVSISQPIYRNVKNRPGLLKKSACWQATRVE